MTSKKIRGTLNHLALGLPASQERGIFGATIAPDEQPWDKDDAYQREGAGDDWCYRGRHYRVGLRTSTD